MVGDRRNFSTLVSVQNIYSFSDNPGPSKHFESTVFFCFHCFDERNPTKSFSGTIDDVTKHWSTAHSAESKPFQFYAVPLVSCFHCNEVIGTYNNLIKHHQEKYAEALFMIRDGMDPTKCGMCNSKDGDLSEHFKKMHDLSSTPKIFNPICYSDERIVELMTINSHIGQTVQTKELIENQIKPDHLICGYCQKNNIDINQYSDHLSKHTFKYRCTMVGVCKYESVHLSQMVFHEKIVHNIVSLDYHCSIFSNWMEKKLFNTDVVFTNGLVLKSYNLVGTSFDDTKLVDKFIRGFLDKEKQRAKKIFADENKRLTSNETNRNGVLNATSNNLHSPVEPTPIVMSEEIGRHGEPSKSRTERDGIDNVASKNKRDSTESSLMSALKDQQELIKNLYVQGITRDLNITDRYGTFLKLCKEMGVTISRSNIESIDQRRKGIIVKLYRMDIKNLIMNQTRGQVVWSNELFELPGNQKPWKVHIGHQMTQFYLNMWFFAMDLKKRKLLHSFKLTKDGLVVKRTPEDDERIVLSEDQLHEHVSISTQSRRSQT